MKTALLILASTLAFLPPQTSSTATSLPDLCDDVYLDEDGVPIHDSTGMTLSRYCEWTGPDAPWWGASVCCSFDAAGAHCQVPGQYGCDTGLDEVEMWCDHGEQTTREGAVTCYQPLPDTCDEGFCDDAPPTAETESSVVVCCTVGLGCIEIDLYDSCPTGTISICDSPYTKEDGTVGCAEDDWRSRRHI